MDEPLDGPIMSELARPADPASPGASPPFPYQAVAERVARADMLELLRLQAELGASDLHLVAGACPRVRLAGRLHPLSPVPLDAERCRQLGEALLTLEQLRTLERERSVLGQLAREGVGRFGVAVFEQARGLSAVVRRIPDAVPPLEWLGLPPIVAQVPRLRDGLVLVTGRRGSGKTTTLAAIVELLNRTRRGHVVTLERPIEYVIPSRTSLVSQREVGRHAPGYAEGLRAALREDPDVIVLAELATPEVLEAALAAAETGHLVLGALPTSGAPRAILRVLDACPGRRRATVRGRLARALRLVLGQHLVPSRDGARQHLAAEVLVVTSAVAALLREDRVHQLPQVMQASREGGMQLRDDALEALVREGKVAAEEAATWAEDPARLLKAGGEG